MFIVRQLQLFQCVVTNLEEDEPRLTSMESLPSLVSWSNLSCDTAAMRGPGSKSRIRYTSVAALYGRFVEESRFGGLLPDCNQKVESLSCDDLACDFGSNHDRTK
jgi:hypothetical protein